MIDKAGYSYDKIFLNFEDKQTESEFEDFSFKFDRKSLKVLSIGMIAGNLFLLTMDITRSNDIVGPVIFRGGISCFMILGALNTYLVKDDNSNLLQLIIFILNLGLIFFFFLAHSFIHLPSYALPNSIYVLMFLAVIFSGQRFRVSIVYSIMVYALYIFFCTQIITNQYWISQINNLTINIIVILAGAYMVEKFRRNIFVTNHIIGLQKKELASSNDLKNKLMSILTHDLRGPINKLIAILNLWKRDNINKRELVEFIQKTELEIERTSALMDNLLFWSKSELEGDRGIYSIVNVSDIVQQHISYFNDQIQFKSIKCRNLVDPSKTIRIEVHILNMCLRNVLSNAIKYSSKKGLIEIGFSNNSGYAEFFISDNGVGICGERKENLFKLSFDSKIGTIGERGSGIGLYILKEFLDNAGGYIECESKPGKGSVFRFGLPTSKITH